MVLSGAFLFLNALPHYPKLTFGDRTALTTPRFKRTRTAPRSAAACFSTSR